MLNDSAFHTQVSSPISHFTNTIQRALMRLHEGTAPGQAPNGSTSRIGACPPGWCPCSGAWQQPAAVAAAEPAAAAGWQWLCSAAAATGLHLPAPSWTLESPSHQGGRAPATHSCADRSAKWKLTAESDMHVQYNVVTHTCCTRTVLNCCSRWRFLILPRLQHCQVLQAEPNAPKQIDCLFAQLRKSTVPPGPGYLSLASSKSHMRMTRV